MKTKWSLPIIVSFILTWPAGAWADDTQIYGSTNILVQPNVLILFDNSGSMADDVPNTPDPYSASTDYSSYGSYTSTRVYKESVSHGVASWASYINDVSSVSCSTASNSLNSTGQYTGNLKTTGVCSGGTTVVVALGNYLNYLQGPGATSLPKVDIARKTVTDLINSTQGVRFGLEVFGSTLNSSTEGGHIVKPILDMSTGTNKADLIAAINGSATNPSTYTPLAEALYEAGLYYKGAASYFNSPTIYTTPIQYSCQKNYIVIMTDGDPTDDVNSVLSSQIGDVDGDGNDPGGAHPISYPSSGSDWLDDVAAKWYNTDLLPSSNVAGSGTQNVVTYTIGFSTGSTRANTLLSAAAANGHGQFYAADSAADLVNAFLSVLGQIVTSNTSFVAPVVPVSPQNRTYSGDYVYIGFFRPDVDAFWSGNVKKYKIVAGQIVDKNGNAATNANGSFKDTAVSYWSTSADGGFVEQGGVGGVLETMTLNPTNFDPSTSGVRKIYTYMGTSNDLTNSTNLFQTANAAITTATLGVSTTTDRNKLIGFIHGQDAYAGTTNTRGWILGDILHSGPAVVSYDNGLLSGHTARSVIYVGANDGMMHAFDDSDGHELWGYIPKNQLSSLINLNGTLHAYFVDGTPKVYYLDNNNNGVIEATDSNGNHDQVILVFGERRGQGSGPSYHALDVTDPDHPKFLWDIKRGDTNLTELGQTWSTPNIVQIQVTVGASTVTKNVFFAGGGYDPVNEDASPATADTQGRAVYAINVADGSVVWKYTLTNNASMTYAFPSDITVLDTNRDGFADRLYIGDVGGRVWRFDVSDLNTSNWSGRILFQSNPGTDGSSGRKILYPPDVTREVGYYFLYVGTGDREHPLDTTTAVDRIYAIKDVDGSSTLLTESDLTDVTTDELQTTTAQSTITADLNALTASSGWFIKLDLNTGEKVVGSPVVFNKVVNIPTFQPTSTSGPVNPCLADVGIGRVYAVNYKTGEAVFNYDATNDGQYSSVNSRAQSNGNEVLLRSDRVVTVGSGIPSEVVIVIPESGSGTCDAMAMAGIGGGVAGLSASCGGTTQRIFWRQLL
jgi:type IV pilus assembly protein PilY1